MGFGESDYVVVRPGQGLPPGFFPPELDGTWFDRMRMPVGTPPGWGAVAGAVAVPTGRFETRDDGAVAEVWEVQL